MGIIARVLFLSSNFKVLNKELLSWARYSVANIICYIILNHSHQQLYMETKVRLDLLQCWRWSCEVRCI